MLAADASRRASLLVAYMRPACSLFAPRRAGASMPTHGTLILRRALSQPRIEQSPLHEAVLIDAKLEETGSSTVQGLADGVATIRRPVAEQAPATACTAHLSCRRACAHRPRDQGVNRRRGHARRETFAVLPLFGDRLPDRVPIPRGHRVAHRHGGVSDSFKTVEDTTVAVDVFLHDVPVVPTSPPN